ncbi:MAG TPA: hypothetical protein VJZ26_11860 [Blastocatellia bacterium]|nr:hypothetical protein [Blastocatellia bacterium]
MKKRLIITLSILALMSFAVAQPAFGLDPQRNRDRDDDRDFSERDEINQTYELTAGARVEVSGINGAVEIETASGSTAEVHIVRTARSREDLNYHKIIIEHTANSLVVRGEKERGYGDKNVRQRVTLKLPRQVDLNVSGINGRTNVGEIDGPVRLSGINGAVDVAQAQGYSDISGINGHVRVSIVRLSSRGIHVSGINGGVELRFNEDLNADLEVTGINGSVNTNVTNVTVMGKFSPQNFRAKIGSGGTPIVVTGINGSLKLGRAGSAS